MKLSKNKKSGWFYSSCTCLLWYCTWRYYGSLQRIGKVSRGNDKFYLGWLGPIAIARRGGTSITLQEMSMFFNINEMIIIGSNYWNMVLQELKVLALQDTEGIETIKLFGENVANLLNKIKN